MMDSIVRIKWKIKDLLAQKGMSYYELSNKADLTGACISNWYSKRNYTPSLDAIIKVCKVLDISLAELFKEEDEEFVCVGNVERDLLNKWSGLNEKQKKSVLMQMDAFLEK
ncbi:MAG: helix-turn-helix transcriptional regulator [Clostridia bacterium]|nr:helix-turn-helix transcriptional regulator [Clostridia bacterium]